MTQEELTLKHVNFLTLEHLLEFLGEAIKRLKNEHITMEFSQKFIVAQNLRGHWLGRNYRTQALGSFRRSNGSVYLNKFRWSQSQLDDQQPPPPLQQNQESQESTSQWKSWKRIKSRFHVSVSLSSASWRIRKGIKKRSSSNHRIIISECEESCHMSCSIHSSPLLLCSCSILLVHQINHLFRT